MGRVARTVRVDGRRLLLVAHDDEDIRPWHWCACAQVFVAPSVRPATMERWRKMKATITGRAMTAETAIRSFHFVPKAFVSPARTTVIGWYCSSVASASPNTNSPHAPRKLTTATVMTPGVLIGTAIRQNAESSLQ